MATATKATPLVSGWQRIAEANQRDGILRLDAWGAAEIAVTERTYPEVTAGRSIVGPYEIAIRGAEEVWARGSGELVSTILPMVEGYAPSGAGEAKIALSAAQAAQQAVAAVAPNVRKINTDADRAPLPSDDETQGYAAGSRWIYNGREWFRSGTGEWVSAGGLTPEHFGAFGGSNFDTAALNAGLAAGAQMNGGGRTYRLDGRLIGGAGGLTNAVLDCSAVTGLSATQFCVEVSGGGYGAPVALTSDASAGSLVVSVTSAADFAKGDLLRAESDAWWSQANNIRRSETVEVASVSGNTVTLTRPLEWALLTSANARIRKINTARTGKWGDLTLIGGGVINGISFSFIRGLRAGNFSFRGFAARNLGLTCCHDFAVGDVDAVAAPGAAPGLNYGVVVSHGCENGTISSVRGYGLRHCFTTGGTDGINRAVKVGTITGVESVAGEYDNHAATRDCSAGMIDVIRPNYQAGEDAIVLQGVNATISGANVDMRETGRHGVFVQPQVDASGDWFFNVNADVRNPPQFSFGYVGLGTAPISMVRGRIGSTRPGLEAVYVEPGASDVFALDMEVVSRGVTNTARAAIRLYQSNDTAKISRSRLAVNSDRDNGYRNIMLQGTAANLLSTVSISGVLSGGTHGVFGSNAQAGTINTTGVQFVGQSSGPSSGI